MDSQASHRISAMRSRLEQVVRDHPQAKLARLTGRSRTALTRYMQGAKIPLEFGGAVCAELGINPAWLLHGSGPMYVADLPAASTELGRNLLELIKTMDAVAGVKVGSLAGKPEARALREISESLALYGSLRDRLNSKTVPVLSELLKQLEEAVNRRHYDRAAALEQTATKVARFTDEPALTRRLLGARAHILHVRQQSPQAIEIETRLFFGLLGSGAPFAEVADSATLLSVALRPSGLAERARRVVRMAKACATRDEARSVDFSILLTQEIMAGVELGEMRGLHELVDHAIAHAPRNNRSHIDMAKLFFYVHGGVVAPRDVAGAPHATFPVAAMVLGVAAWTEDADLIERALAPVRALCNPQMPLNLAHLQAGERVLAVLRGRHEGAAFLDALHKRGHGFSKQWQALHELTSIAQLLRLAGDARATPLVFAAQDLLDACPLEHTPAPIAVARHLRNVLTGIPAKTRNIRQQELRKKAETLCRQRIAQGFGLLRELLPTAAHA